MNNKYRHIEFQEWQCFKGTWSVKKKDFRTKLKKENALNFAVHGQRISESFNSLSNSLEQKFRENNRYEILKGVPFVLQIDPDDSNIEFIQTKLKLEIICEHEDGFILVSNEDLEFEHLQAQIEDFCMNGTDNGIASVINFQADSNRRLERILSKSLYESWHIYPNDRKFIVEVSVECLKDVVFPKEPTMGKKWKEETKNRKLQKWKAEIEKLNQQISELELERESLIENFIKPYNAVVLDQFTDCNKTVAGIDFFDSFVMKIEISFQGLKDLAENFPFVFEIKESDEIDVNADCSSELTLHHDAYRNILSPDDNSPKVCIIDSGIQEQHKLVKTAIKDEDSQCYINSGTTSDEANHGTRVCGLVLYPQEEFLSDNSYKLPCFIQNAKVLNHTGGIPSNFIPAKLLREIFIKYNDLGTKLFCHSINSHTPARNSLMSSWGFEIDKSTYLRDILLIQSAGNIPPYKNPSRPSIENFFEQNIYYPDYLEEESSRIRNPAQSLNALVVGAINSFEKFDDGIKKSITGTDEVSSYSAVGYGIWNSIKPDVVIDVGDLVTDTSVSQIVFDEKHVYNLLSSTNTGKPYAKDANCVGTSFAAPKVLNIAAKIQAQYPEASGLFIRGLIIHSASWPKWTENKKDKNALALYFKRLGYVPSFANSIFYCCQ